MEQKRDKSDVRSWWLFRDVEHPMGDGEWTLSATGRKPGEYPGREIVQVAEVEAPPKNPYRVAVEQLRVLVEMGNEAAARALQELKPSKPSRQHSLRCEECGKASSTVRPNRFGERRCSTCWASGLGA